MPCEGDEIDEAALTALVQAAVALNTSEPTGGAAKASKRNDVERDRHRMGDVKSPGRGRNWREPLSRGRCEAREALRADQWTVWPVLIGMRFACASAFGDFGAVMVKTPLLKLAVIFSSSSSPSDSRRSKRP